MAETTAPGSVPLSRPEGGETAGHFPVCRDRAGTLADTVDLKALARLVLARTHAETPSETGCLKAL